MCVPGATLAMAPGKHCGTYSLHLHHTIGLDKEMHDDSLHPEPPNFSTVEQEPRLEYVLCNWICVTTNQERFPLLRHDECEWEVEDDQEASQGSLLTTLW